MTWRVTLPGAWGRRLDSEWLPADHTEVWRRVFAGEDLAGQIFRSGGQDPITASSCELPKMNRWRATTVRCTLRRSPPPARR
jgi:hypothetical protein